MLLPVFSTYITLYLSSTNSISHIKERGNLITDKLTHYTQITTRISLIIKRTIYEALVANKFRNIHEVTRSPIIMGSSTKNIVGTCYNVAYAQQKFIIFIIIYFVTCYIKRWSFFSSRYNVSRSTNWRRDSLPNALCSRPPIVTVPYHNL